MFEKLIEEEVENNTTDKYITLYGCNCSYEMFVQEVYNFFGEYNIQINDDWLSFKIRDIEVTINTNKSQDMNFFKNQAIGMKNYFSKSKMPEGELKSNILHQIEMFNSIFGICVKEPSNHFDVSTEVFSKAHEIAVKLNLFPLYSSMDLYDGDDSLLISFYTGKSQFIKWEAQDKGINRIKELNPNIKSSNTRRKETIEILKEKDVGYKSNLSLKNTSCELCFKDTDEVCRRTYITFLTAWFCYEVLYGENKEKTYPNPKILEDNNLLDYINSKEIRLYDGTYSQMDVDDISWTFECLGVLLWSLGLMNDFNINDSSQNVSISNCMKTMLQFSNFEDFKKACKLKSEEEILDKADLYYCYQWAIIENKWHADISAGNLNPEIVLERRRALEWLISPEFDWYDINLDA